MIARRFLICAAFALLFSSLCTETFAQEGLSDAMQRVLIQAQAGDVTSQRQLAAAYDTGQGAPRDGKQAMKWYRAAAESGDAESQNSVGSGLQADKQYEEARVWYEKASAQGLALATNNLAYLYDLGLGVPQDRRKAFELYSRAADLGWAEAMWNIANMYGAGQLGEPDIESACVWIRRAQQFATAHDHKVLTLLPAADAYLRKQLTPEKLRTCSTRAMDWFPKATR